MGSAGNSSCAPVTVTTVAECNVWTVAAETSSHRRGSLASRCESLVMWRWFVLRTEWQGRRDALLELAELALGRVEPGPERADERVEISNQPVLKGELDL